MPLLKNGRLTADAWTHWRDDGDDPGGPVIVSLRRWRDHREDLLRRGTPLGIQLTSEQTPGEIRDDLEHFAVVALDFPTFADGRSYSNARRLRDRFNYTGEVRATGEILRDQYLALKRCGFDALVVRQGETEADWEKAVNAISVPMQPALDDKPTAMSLRQRRLAG